MAGRGNCRPRGRVAPGLLLLLLIVSLHHAVEGSNGARPALRKVTFPGKTWALALDLPGFEFSNREARSDGKGISVFGSNESTGLIISVYLEHAAGTGDARACRDYYLSRSKSRRLDRRDVRVSDRDHMALVEYFGPRVGNPALDNQRHINAYMAHDGIWIDIHLSKMDFKPADRDLFDTVLNSVRIIGDTATDTTTAVFGTRRIAGGRASDLRRPRWPMVGSSQPAWIQTGRHDAALRVPAN